ncbi:MAG: glycosyltransferase [Gammaproteobacteria bacterium]|nr:glycosyltransferase [Gammaproteobacteria bacterium]
MNILLLTNTFSPHVGGVARSVEAFRAQYRQRGHRVLVVAPEFSGMPAHEEGVIRIPAIRNFNATEFSVALPLHPRLSARLDNFRPDIVHSQHPFLLGMTALRIARSRLLPLVFTHHTLYEQYTHYVPGDSPALKRFAIALATRYANLTDKVFAPSESLRALLQERGVTTPIAVVPTGITLHHFAQGDGRAFRRQLGIPEEAFVAGHLGRLAPEKNLEFLARALAAFATTHPQAHLLIIGSGPAQEVLRQIVEQAGVATRLHIVGILQQQPLADALHAMDLFAFASQSETQGIVLIEAMAAGLPVVALDGGGTREVVRDGVNGRLLPEATPETFSAALQWVVTLPPERRRALTRVALKTAAAFSMPRCADKALAGYAMLTEKFPAAAKRDAREWEEAASWMKAEWEILKSVVGAGDAALCTHLFNERFRE